MAHDGDVVSRAVRFEWEIDATAAGARVAHPLGELIACPELPGKWTLNQLGVLGAHPRLTAPALAAELDRLQDGLRHRRAWLEDTATGDRLAPWFRDSGWDAVRLGVMALEREPPAPPPGRVRPASEAEMRLLDRAVNAEAGDIPADLVEEVAAGNARVRETSAARGFVGLDSGEPVSRATLFSDGSTAQVEDVATLLAHRGRGLAGAVVAHAARLALGERHELVFLVVDLDEGPASLYERVGFRLAGHCWTFTRRG